jgi:ABC-type dipeptide/oligopeptide/nickel transport system permease subunit
MTVRPALILATGWLVIVVAAAVLAPVLATADPRQPVGEAIQPPSPAWWMGTDSLGRDLWSRMLYGARLSLGATILAATTAVFAGGLAGLLAATLRGPADKAILFAANAALAVPGLLLALLLVAGLGPTLPAVVLAVGLGGAPGFTRVARTVFLQVQQSDFIPAAVALGGDLAWIARRHLLPNARSNLLTLAATQFAWSFLGITTLTFLGLAGDPSIPEWGAMLQAGRADLISAPRLAILPGAAISFTVLAVYTLADSLGRRTALRPSRMAGSPDV